MEPLSEIKQDNTTEPGGVQSAEAIGCVFCLFGGAIVLVLMCVLAILEACTDV